MNSRNSAYSVPMLEKGFELLEYISQRSGGVAMRSMVEDLSISKTTIFRLLISLTDMGYIYKNDETAEYFLTKKLLRLGLPATGEAHLVEHALPLMRTLRDEVGEIVMIGVWMNNRAVLLEQVQGSHSFTFLTRAGTSFVTHASVPGKIFAAYAKSTAREQIIEGIDFVRFNENTIASAEEFLAEIDSVKHLGYAIDLEEEVKGVNCLGVPIYNQFGEVTAALWTSGPSGRLTEAKILEIKDRVIEIGHRISVTLGYSEKLK